MNNKTKKVNVLMLGPGLDVKGGISSVEKIVMMNSPDEINFRHISTMEDGSLIKKLFVFAKALILSFFYLIFGKLNAVHIHFSSRGSTLRKIILIWMIVLFRKPFILHAHGSEFHLFFASLPAIAKAVIRKTFQQCSKFIALSNSWRHFYIEHLKLGKDIILVLPNPVQFPDHIENRKGRTKYKIIFLGRIGERKGAFDLIHAFSDLLQKESFDVDLILAGDGEIDRAKQLVRSFSLENRVFIKTWVGPSEKQTLFNESDLFVLPSFNEGLPMSLLESMVNGLPVITSPVGGIPELIKHKENGLLVTPGDIVELQKALHLVLSDEDFRIKLGNAARQSVEKLDIRPYLVILKNIYQSPGKDLLPGKNVSQLPNVKANYD